MDHEYIVTYHGKDKEWSAFVHCTTEEADALLQDGVKVERVSDATAWKWEAPEVGARGGLAE